MHADLNLKICGMRDPENIREVCALRPDYIGLIFYPDSPRYVGEEFIWPVGIPESVKKVGVFVNESTKRILDRAARYDLHCIQLHGNESEEQCHELKASGLTVIKAFAVDDEFNFSILNPYRRAVDYYLFDTRGKYFGGNATSFNWEILKRYDQQLPFFLSGGLSPGNIQNTKGLLSMNLHALDINSGVELKPGLKDLSKVIQVTEIISILKRHNQHY